MVGKIKIIIDCDPGVDDMEAIFLAVAAKHVEIVAITAVPGNSVVDQTYNNIQKILYHCGRTDIPVYKGQKINFLGDEVSTDGYFGADGLCELNLKYDESIPPQKLNSAQALLHYAQMYPGMIHLVAIGPLTNLAIAYLTDSSFPLKLASLHIMGGDRSEISINNVTKYAEFNCYCDPPAWKLVTKSFRLSDNKKINIIDYKFCVEHMLPNSFLERYFNSPLSNDPLNKKAQLVKMTHEFMAKKNNIYGNIIADSFALFVCIYPEYKYTGRTAVVKKIHMEGETYGHTEFQYCEDGHLLLLDKIDFDNFLRLMFDSIYTNDS